jgi:hypothetical protein
MNQLYISSSDKKIFLELFSNRKPLDIYYFHKQYLFSPAQISRFLRTYCKKRIIEFSDNKIYLTEHGKNWIIRNRYSIFLSQNKTHWVKIPEDWKVKDNQKISNTCF